MRVLLVTLCIAAAARASSISDEVVVNTTQPTETNPRSGSVGDSLRLSLDLSDSVSIDLRGMLTSQNNSPSELPKQTGDAAVGLVSGGVDWQVTDAWSLSPHGEWSPTSTNFADAPVQLLAGAGTAHIRSVSSEIAAGLDIGYDTTGESDLEWSFSGGFNYTHWNIDQSVPRITNAGGTVVSAATLRTEIQTFCSNHPNLRNCGKTVLREIAAVPFDLDSEEFSLSATAIVARDTDLVLGADYYSYNQDPAQAGYASVIFNGRGGAGVPVAPLRFMVRPEVVHRWGAFSASLILQAGRYIPGTGEDWTASIGTRLQYKFGKTFRLWLRIVGQRDVDDTGADTRSGTFSLGASYRL